jgi:hypothetical protein
LCSQVIYVTVNFCRMSIGRQRPLLSPWLAFPFEQEQGSAPVAGIWIRQKSGCKGFYGITGSSMYDALPGSRYTVSRGGGVRSGVRALALSAPVIVMRMRWPAAKMVEVG